MAKPWEILAVTFTNKAANEMKERIVRLAYGVGRESWIGTFHSVCARVLRMDGQNIGFSSNFTVFDRDDQIRFVKTIMQELNIPTKMFAPEAIISRISRAKNSLIGPGDFESHIKDALDEKADHVYAIYQTRLKDNNIMDFDDLLANPIHLFNAHPQILQNYQKRFKYILVDEYQDTNHTQYIFLKKLAADNANLCVVGDDDQSIYRWRGADVQNILNIKNDYPKITTFRLEQNYRSTQSILDVANSVVQHNRKRHAKKLWTEKAQGEKVAIVDLQDQTEESLFVVASIKDELQRNGRNFGDFVILYRTNAQSRVFEDALRARGIPYVIVGGVRFYERKEIKDILAYLRLICNTGDSVSFKRIINFPLRGIGDTSIAKLEQFSSENNISLLEAAARVDEISTIAQRTRKSIEEFYKMIDKYASLKGEFSAGELARAVVDDTGILRIYKDQGTEEAYNRAENIRELLSAIASYMKEDGSVTLDDFLEEISLQTDIDSWDDRSNAITLMTIHSAKGLEFPVVFVAGLEEGLFPLTRTYIDDEELEEERRLFYVGITRAMEKLYITWAARRLRFGEYLNNLQSRFLKEIDESLVTRICKKYEAPKKIYHDHYNTVEETIDEMPNYEDFSQETVHFNVGSHVKHTTFGMGIIVGIEGRGENTKLKVRFQNNGDKKLVAKYAKLEIVSL
jgi:DNA helicase-2/ATP-dependent DNA helicase PcrA